MGGLALGTPLAFFGIGMAIFFILAGFLIRAPNKGLFRFFFISIGLIATIATAGSMAFIARATEGTTEDVSAIAPTYDYVVYAISIILLLWVVYFILGILVSGVSFAMSFMDETGLNLRKKRKIESIDDDLPDY